jgi:hypothetical protein
VDGWEAVGLILGRTAAATDTLREASESIQNAVRVAAASRTIDVAMVFVGMTWYLPVAGACDYHPLVWKSTSCKRELQTGPQQAPDDPNCYRLLVPHMVWKSTTHWELQTGPQQAPDDPNCYRLLVPHTFQEPRADFRGGWALVEMRP